MGDTRLTVRWGTAEVKLGVYISTQSILSRATAGFHTLGLHMSYGHASVRALPRN